MWAARRSSPVSSTPITNLAEPTPWSSGRRSRRRATEGADVVLGQLATAIDGAVEQATTAVAGVALAFPGPFDVARGRALIRGLHKFDSIYGLELRPLLAERISRSDLRIGFARDSEAAGVGEATFGAGRGGGRVLTITLGTGARVVPHRRALRSRRTDLTAACDERTDRGVDPSLTGRDGGPDLSDERTDRGVDRSLTGQTRVSGCRRPGTIRRSSPRAGHWPRRWTPTRRGPAPPSHRDRRAG